MGEVASAAVGNDADGAIAEVEGEGGVGLFEMKDDGGRVGGLNRFEGGEGAGFYGDDGAVEDGVDGPLHVTGSERAAVVEMDAGAEVKNPGKGVRSLPAGGEEGLKAEVLVAANECVEEQGVDVLGLGVGTDAGIEVGGAGLDEHGDGVGVGLLGAAEEAEHRGQSAEHKTAFSV